MKEWIHEKCGTNTPPSSVPYTSPGATICKENSAIRKLEEKRKNLYSLLGQAQFTILERERDINIIYDKIKEVNYKIKSLTT